MKCSICGELSENLIGIESALLCSDCNNKKLCKECNISKSKEDFYKYKNGSMHYKCKDCFNKKVICECCNREFNRTYLSKHIERCLKRSQLSCTGGAWHTASLASHTRGALHTASLASHTRGALHMDITNDIITNKTV